MIARLLAPLALLALCGCGEDRRPSSLVGDFPVPGAYAVARDTITVWRRQRQPDGAWRFHSWSITSGGTVEYLDELERVEMPASLEEGNEVAERRKSFVLAQTEFETIRHELVRLRPAAMGPDDPVRGYAGEVHPAGCTPDPAQPRLAGVNFLNDSGWGAFVLPAGCASERGKTASAVMADVFGRLERAADQKR